ncbi:hypothetical protein [Qipengyuania soli]|uniref:Uncharacterized protein n=1 Tax=Qipengyuania soli TaxID=2782568 RepID=A0A7S8F273_9SPHN|nr:hypothetical protein [Qipengyuania soli]QPC97764.1 hypothetical protein IRL76_07550 [Qipengyuania soli]
MLADRALNGVEEAVFYHGEEVARRRRYDSRLLLAHLARLDRMAERPEVQAALALLDDQIEGLARGEELSDPATAACPRAERGEKRQDRVPPVPSCRDCGGDCDIPHGELGPDDCQWYPNRIARMEEARPDLADTPDELARELAGERGVDWEECADAIEGFQLEAFEADGYEWWLVTDEPGMMDSILHDYREEEEEGS